MFITLWQALKECYLSMQRHFFPNLKFMKLVLDVAQCQIWDDKCFNTINFVVTNNLKRCVGENSLRSTKFLSHGHRFHVLVLKGLIGLGKVIQSNTWPKLFRWYLYKLQFYHQSMSSLINMVDAIT